MSKFVKTLVFSALGAIFAATAFNAPSAYATGDHTPTCVDGNKRSNLSVTWVSANKVSVKTIDNKLLCEDTTVYFSTYVMPANYDGKPFTDNPTASPQQMFASTKAVLKANTTGTSTLSAELPENCKNIQVDLYYAPEIVTVTAKGHGDQYITGKIYPKIKDTCTPTKPVEEKPPVVPPTEAQTPPTPAPEVKVQTPIVQAKLPETGLSLGAVIATGAVLSAATYAAAYALGKRQ